ncbi:hypothetical protein [Sphingomonas sp. PB4P5]|uniref:hypothetical protein n=1 Tax=Parasphingomonas puruogangriensis TaxID=3096155 RepID=UPI002FC5F3D7
MTRQSPSRRAVMGAALAGPAVLAGIAIPAAAAAKAISPGLAALIEAHRQANATLDRWYAEVFNPAVDAHTAATMAHRAKVAAIPHIVERTVDQGGRVLVLHSKHRDHRAIADGYVATESRFAKVDCIRGKHWDEAVAACGRFIAADDERNAKIAALGDEPRDRVSTEVENAAYAPVLAAGKKIAQFHATTAADLQAKLAWIDSDDGMDGEELLPLVIADVARIVGEA